MASMLFTRDKTKITVSFSEAVPDSFLQVYSNPGSVLIRDGVDASTGADLDITELSAGTNFHIYWFVGITDIDDQSVSTLPALTATAASDTQINVGWAIAGGTLGLDWSPDNSTWTAIEDFSTSPYAHTSLTASTHYYYRATDDAGASGYVYADATTQSSTPNPPGTPSGLAASTNFTDKVHLSWSSVTGAVSYTIKRTNFDATVDTITGVTGTSYNDTDAKNLGWIVGYQIKALDAYSQESAYTAVPVEGLRRVEASSGGGGGGAALNMGLGL